MKQERLDNVQILRGIAAVSVIVGHAFEQFTNHPISGMPALHSYLGGVWGNGVDVFFVISGFIMYYLSHDHFAEAGYPAEFLKRRVIRVAPTYWLFTTMMIAAALASPAQVNNGVGSVWHAISSYFFIPSPRPDGMMHPVLGLGWTLDYEFFFYACYAAALLLPRRSGIPALAFVFVGLALAHPLLPAGVLAFWSDPIILEFVAGIFLAMAFVRGYRFSRPAYGIVLMVLGIALMLMMSRLTPDVDRVIRSGMPSLLLAAALIYSPNLGGWRAPILIGDASYALYLSHPFALNAVTALWRKVRLPAESYLYLGTLVVLSLAGGIAVYLLVERPLVSMLRRRFEPRRERLAA